MYNTSYYVRLAFGLLDAVLRRIYGYHILGAIAIELYAGWVVQVAGGGFWKGAALTAMLVLGATIIRAFATAIAYRAPKNKPFWENLLPGILNIILQRCQVYKVLGGVTFVACVSWVTFTAGGDYHCGAWLAGCTYISALLPYILAKRWRSSKH